MKPWQRIIEQTSKMNMGWPHGKLPLLGVGKVCRLVTVRHEMGWAQGGRNRPITNRSEKKTGGMKETYDKRKKRKGTHGSSSASSSIITKSVSSGRWCGLQYPKYPDFVCCRAPFVSSVAGCRKTGDIGSSPAPWHADTA